jgi:two-component system, NtrC family, sensor kinase
MKIILILTVMIFFQHNSAAQNWEQYDHKIDSLKKLLNSSSDTIRANAIIEYGGILVNKAWNATNQGEFALAYETYDTAFELFENPDTEKFFKSFNKSSGFDKRYWNKLANINFNYGHLMGVTENLEECLRFYRKTYDIAQKQKDTLHLVYTNSGMVMLYLVEKKLDSAMVAAERAMSYDPKAYNYMNYPIMLYINGALHMYLGDYDLAKINFLKGIEYSNLSKSIDHMAINSFGLSKVYRELNERDSSYQYGKQALNIFKVLKEMQMLKIDLASAYENMYWHFQKFEKQDSAFKYLQLSSEQRTIFSQKTISNLAAFQQVLLNKQLRLKNLEKKQIESQAKNRTYLFVAVFFVFIVIGAMLFYSNHQKQKTNVLLFNKQRHKRISLNTCG